VLGDVDEHFSGDYLNQQTVMRAARAAGLSTAAIGKLGPALIFDHTERAARDQARCSPFLDDVCGTCFVASLRIDFAVLDAVAGLLVELVKADFLALRGGWEQSNWAGNEGQLEITLPVGTRRHDVLRY
jgi:hypothetical protein